MPLGISLQQLMGLGRVEPHNEGESFCMTVLGLEAFAPGQCRQRLAWPRFAPHVGPFVAVARRRRNSHRPHHQRRARSHVAGLADAAALRPHFRGRLDAPHGQAGNLAGNLPLRSRRIVGNALRAEELAVAIRPPPRQPAMPPPWRERRSGRVGPQSARSEHSDHRLRPPLRHLQAGRLDYERSRSLGRDW